MYGVQTATVWASVSGMPGPILAQITASGEAVAVFTAVVVGLSSTIGVLFKVLMDEQKAHRAHVSELVKEAKADRKEYMVEMKMSWNILSEIEEKRQADTTALTSAIRDLTEQVATLKARRN